MLNAKQKIIIIVGIVAFVVIGMFPPWLYTHKGASINTVEPAGYSFIAIPPRIKYETIKKYDSSVKLDISRIVIQWVTVFVSTGLVVFLLWEKKNKSS